MHAILSRARKRILAALGRNKTRLKVKDIDDKIYLGILLRGVGAVAEADKEFKPEEEKEIREILLEHTNITKKDLPVVMMAIRQTSFGRNDFYNCVKSINRKLTTENRTLVLENLFRVACADKKLHRDELKVIKKVAGLLGVSNGSVAEIMEKIKTKSKCARGSLIRRT